MKASGLRRGIAVTEHPRLIMGKPGTPTRAVPKDWKDYFAYNAVPCLKDLTFVGRAITPPYRPKRFDARFFMVDADAALLDDRPALKSAELVDVRWVSLPEAHDLDLPSVTRFMIGEIEDRLKHKDRHHSPAFLRWTQKGHQLIRI